MGQKRLALACMHEQCGGDQIRYTHVLCLVTEAIFTLVDVVGSISGSYSTRPMRQTTATPKVHAHVYDTPLTDIASMLQTVVQLYLSITL